MGSFLGCKIYGVNSQTAYPCLLYTSLVVRKQEHVSGSGGVFQITGLAVHSAHGAVFKGVFLRCV